MEAATILSPEEKKAARAQKERERRAAKKAETPLASAPRTLRALKDPEGASIAARAKEIAPSIKSAYQPFEVRSLMVIVGGADPIAFAGVPEEALLNRNVRDVIAAWACGELETRDPAAMALRAKAREVANDDRAKNLWGRKIGALLLAIDEARRA